MEELLLCESSSKEEPKTQEKTKDRSLTSWNKQQTKVNNSTKPKTKKVLS